MSANQKFEDIFNKWDEAEDFSGVISISNKGATVYEKIQGFRNKGEKIPNQKDTAFGTASVGKLFTAAAICQLIDQGKLSLESKIGDVLPQDLKAVDKNVTVLQLLTHSSGIADYLDFDDKESEVKFYNQNPVNLWLNNEAYLPFFNAQPSKFKPGTQTGYSNSNFILLGLIIEALSGEGYHAYIAKNIIMPLNLTRTGFHATNNLPANTAVGYVWSKSLEEYVGNYFFLPIIGAADGGLYTTTADMALFWKGIFEGKLFSQSMLEEFLTPRTFFDDIDGHIGLCVFVSEKEGHKIYWHDGGDYGVFSYTAYIPRTGDIITILSNVSLSAGSFPDELIQLLITKP